MSELQIIESALERAARRRRWACALRGLWVGLLWGGLFYLTWLGAYRLTLLFQSTYSLSLTLQAAQIYILGAAITCPLIGFILGGWRRLQLAEIARWVDVKHNLKERMSTALEFSKDDHAGTWRELVMHDAVSHAQEIDPKKLVPFHLPRATRWALLVIALAAGLGFVPEYRSKANVQKQTDAKVIKEVGKQIAELTKRDLQVRPPALETTKKSLEAVSELGDQLNKKALTRSEALKDIANATDKLKDQLKEMGKDPGLRKLEQASRSPSGSQGQTGSGAQKQVDGQKESAAANADKLDKLQKELEKLQETAKAMADKTGEAAEAERQKLAAQISSLSQQAAQAGVELPQLDDAIKALEANQTDRFMKDLDLATTDLEKLRDMAKKMEAAQAQAEKIGKDLAEQLKNGQADAAAQTLKKLAEQLKNSNLSQQQMDQVLQEVSKALPESSDYGKVADMLKEGVQQMQKGDKPNASQSLANAAAELEKLMQQMADAQSMMASLENLDQASQCIGQGKGWGMCQGTKPGYNPFGKNPGPGVGTWAQDGGEWIENYDDGTGNIDRSSLDKRDQEGRGLSERDQKMNDGLAPSKVKGQFTPGGPMPSITLKGVNIKGSSKVQYEEAATAAQADAQSALSQEKVPRAYQGAVKDYFDDLKK